MGRVLAEIVNADNLPAAARAASRALAVHDTTVIPSEVLIARCVAAVCQRRGLAELLTQLLRSEGREIYAWERAGICRRDGDRWKIDRAHLDRLCVGFERTAGTKGVARIAF